MLRLQLNEAELEVAEKASYKQKLEVLQQQEELIEDEEEQEQKEEDARRAKKESDELETRTAQALLPDSEVVLSFGIENAPNADSKSSATTRST